MILNTKFQDIREIIYKKIEEFFNSLDHLENHLEIKLKSLSIDEDFEMQDSNKINENGENTINRIVSQENNENNKIYLSTSQIMTKILLGKIYFKI